MRALIDRGSALRQGAATREDVFTLREQLAGALRTSKDFRERMYISSALLNVTQVGGNGLLTPQETMGGPGVIGLATESMAFGGSNASVRPGIGLTPSYDGPSGRSAFRRYENTMLAKEDFANVESGVSQKQLRHIDGRQEYRGGGYLNSVEDAQAVLNAYQARTAVILGKSQQGFPIVRVDGVTGINVNVNQGITSQATNVFMIKGTASPSVVPMNPNWKPK